MFFIRYNSLNLEPIHHRIRIKTEEKAKVVFPVWGTEIIQFLASLHSYFALG